MSAILVFNTHPDVEIATVVFEQCEVVLQYEKTPLIQIVREVLAGFEFEIPIYAKDGVYLAKVRGSRLFLTDDGRKAGLKLRHPPNMTVCELDGKTVFEIRRTGAAALRASAELFSPDGAFIRCDDKGIAGWVMNQGGAVLQVGNLNMSHCRIRARVGITVFRDGSAAIASP